MAAELGARGSREARRDARTLALVMEGAMSLTVPLKVDIGIGANWSEAHL
jgi:DNA polymerase I-like protein with 3'-5' exonuclease and polymerase domains